MADKILNFIKKLIPHKLFELLQPAYHFTLGYLAALWYGNPSDKIIVVGVTGTTGKTTTVFLLANILKEAGMKTGYITTAMFSDGNKEWLNDKKMTMLGRFFTQGLLRQMVRNKCEVAIVETTSQGIVQFRHRFINYDILVFTGLYPEHIEAHGGFENYKQAKGKLFAHLKDCRRKKLGGKEVLKTIIINADDKYAEYFQNFWAEEKMLYTCHPSTKLGMTNIIRAENIISNNKGLQFTIEGLQFSTNLLGDFNAVNSLAAISAARMLYIPMEKIKAGLEKIEGIPGRLEKIPNDKGFTIIIDYAFEPNAVAKLYETVKAIPHSKIIHVLGACGGGRDRSKRPILGKLAGKNADYIIITNEDPYDEDPTEIINNVESGIMNHELGKNSWKILDRREAIKKALAMAGQNDIVLVTGKGSEQAICAEGGKKIPWDDRKVTRELLPELR
jgi:UDP-N-acetylmuramoyl-L-alanyl-D-glutamate--2,6-diaminopimelate ligase